MKANELMIGDCVNLKNGKVIMPCRITVIGHATQDRNEIGTTVCVDLSKEFPTCIFDMDVITPIPLTPKIIEKNGFYLGYTSNQEDAASQIHCTLPEPMWTWDEGAGSIQISFPNESDGGEMYLSDQKFDRDLHFVFCENIYVHELQHAIRLCGIDKEIEL